MKRLLCLIGHHDWTCRAKEGLDALPRDAPATTDSTSAILEKFRSYASMYCKRCGKVHSP